MPKCDKCSNLASRSQTWNLDGGNVTIWYCKQHLQTKAEIKRNEIKF